MRPHLSLICTLLAAAAAAGIAPARAAEPVPRPPTDLGAEVWRLRPSQPALPTPLPAQPALSARGARPAGEIPEARRSVRVVYPALTEAR